GRAARIAGGQREEQGDCRRNQEGYGRSHDAPVDVDDAREGHLPPPPSLSVRSPSGVATRSSCSAVICDCASMRPRYGAGARPNHSTPTTTGSSTYISRESSSAT